MGRSGQPRETSPSGTPDRGEADPDQPGTPPRTVSLPAAIAIAVANMIGVGVFTSLGFQVKDIPSPFAVLVLWTLGGLVALCGALCYAELSTALRRSGGEYMILSRIYHPAVGFLAGWISATVGFSAPVALAAMAFAGYAAALIPGISQKAAALSIVWLASAVLLAGAKPGIVLTNAATVLKVFLVTIFILAGVVFAPAVGASLGPTPGDLAHMVSAPFMVSLVYVMYAYSGWNALSYISEEVREPGRTLPWASLSAVAIVTALSLALNAVFLYTTPISALAGQVDVGVVVGRQLFGDTGARAVAAIICIGLVSAITAMMWIGPRVTMVMGEDLPALRAFAVRSADGVPRRAVVLQMGLASGMLLSGSFEQVLEFAQVGLLASSFLAVLGVIVLRVREPDLARPFRVWAYPVPPVIFLAVTALMILHLLREKPVQALAGVALLAAGLVAYALSGRFKETPR